MDNIVGFTDDAGEPSQQQISFDVNDLLQAIRIEHFMLKCSKNHNQSEMEVVLFDCNECRGTDYVLTPAGEVFSALIKRQGLRMAKENLRMSQERT